MAAEPHDRAPKPSRRAQLRAVFVAFHLVAIVTLALPSPGAGMRRSAWKDPTVQAEFRAWAHRLQAAGVETSPAALEERAWRVARDWVALRSRLTAPFRPYADVVGTRQPWRMFVAPHRYPAVLHVDVELDGEWSPVYVARSQEHDWRGRELDHDRMRAAIFRYGWPRYAVAYRSFVTWLARKAAVDYPRASRIRARLYKYRTRTPEEVRAGAPVQGAFQRSIELELERFR